MSWVDHCKIAFNTEAKNRLYQTKGRYFRSTIKKMAIESGIDKATLDTWWNESGNANSPYLCKRCCTAGVEINNRTGKPYGEGSKNHGLCSECRRKSKNWGKGQKQPKTQ